MTSFIQTRSRKTNPETSREAGKEAASDRSARIRACIPIVIAHCHSMEVLPNAGIGWTAKEISAYVGYELASVYRRLPECSGIKRDPVLRRDGCSVWIRS